LVIVIVAFLENAVSCDVTKASTWAVVWSPTDALRAARNSVPCTTAVMYMR